MLVKSLLELPRDTDLREVVLDHLARVEDQLTAVFERARDLGELPPDADPARLAQRIQTYIFGLKIQAQRHTDPARMQMLCADLAEEIGRSADRPSTGAQGA